jgi:PAS domain-containing protein
MRPLDFKSLFEAAPGSYLVLDPDLIIVAASDGYLEETGTVREAILGRELRDRGADAMQVQRRDVQPPGGGEGAGLGRGSSFWVEVPVAEGPVQRADRQRVNV